MNTNRILLAGLVGGIFAFFLGWLVFGILLKDSIAAGILSVMRPDAEMIMWAMVVSNLLWGIFLAYIFVQWANISTWMSGAKAAALLGFLISAAFDTGLYSMTTLFTMQEMAMDVIMNTIWIAIVGAFIGWWLGWKK